jgi:hypothetical protein
LGLAATVVACGGNGGGVSSRDELVRRAVAAVTAGDVDTLVVLADHDALARKVMDCEPGGAAAIANRMRDSFRRAVDRARGLEAHVGEIHDGRIRPRHAGDRVGSCKFASDVTTLELEVEALVARPGKAPRRQSVAMMVVEVGGGWYLLGAPKLADPAADEAIAKMTEFRDAMCACADKPCAERVSSDMTRWSSDAGPGPKLDEADTRQVADMMAAYTQCQTKAITAIPGLPPECEDYRQAIERVANCDKLPAASRDALKQAFDSMSQNWGTMTDPSARNAMSGACRAATDALNQAMSSMCP